MKIPPLFPSGGGFIGGSKGALSRKQRLQRKPALAASPVGRPRKPSLFITKPDVSKVPYSIKLVDSFPYGSR